MKKLLCAGLLSAGLAALAMPAAAQDGLAIDGDADRGERVYRQCRSCHGFDPNRRLQGPHLVGIFGRQAGAVEGFRYSRAMRDSGIEWTEESLTAYLTDPRGYLPGTTMVQRIRNPDDMPDLLAYIMRESAAAEAQ